MRQNKVPFAVFNELCRSGQDTFKFHPSTNMGKSVKKTKTKAILKALSDSALNASPVRMPSGAAKGRGRARGNVLCRCANRSLEE